LIFDLVAEKLNEASVYAIKTTFKKKFQIAALLGAGGLATGASIAHLVLVFQPNSSADETVTFVRFSLLG
jgi:hypothetical protein